MSVLKVIKTLGYIVSQSTLKYLLLIKIGYVVQQETSKQTCFTSLPVCYVTSGMLPHDENVECVHHEHDERLPPRDLSVTHHLHV